MGKKLYWVFGIAVMLLLVMFVLPSSITGFTIFSGGSELDEFSSCLVESGAKMYGAYWCNYCKQQKKEFGRSWKVFEDEGYIECSVSGGGMSSECQREGIKSYPTWEFADGQRSTGVIAKEQLSAITGCSLPA
tara:strand:+ start:499 stop:897 length:399 start_codon:yes stop_codon:yes gene_type:complete